VLDSVVLAVGLGALFLAVSVAVLSLSGGGGPTTGVARSLAQIDQLSGRNVAARQDLQFGDRVVSPALHRMVALARRLSPKGVAERIQHHLDLAGNPPDWSVERVFAYKGVGLLAGAGAGALISSGGLFTLVLWCGGFAAAGFFLPDLLTYNKGLKRQQQIQNTLPDALDMLTVSVEAGLGFDAALSQVTKNTDGPLAGEFFRVLQEMQIGRSRADAFRSMIDRTTVADLRNFVSAIVQADALGIPIANVLREQSKEMRLKRRQRAEEKAQKIPIKILFPMIFFIFPALFVVIIGPGAITIIRTFSSL
jgi:tight adherence protein C